MPYADGSWGKRARLRSKRRLEYFREYVRQHPLNYKYKQCLGDNIPKNIDLSFFVRERGLRCQLCGKLPGPERYRGLLIHHRDGNIENNGFENLMIICKGCHNRIHFSGWYCRLKTKLKPKAR